MASKEKKKKRKSKKRMTAILAIRSIAMDWRKYSAVPSKSPTCR